MRVLDTVGDKWNSGGGGVEGLIVSKVDYLRLLKAHGDLREIELKVSWVGNSLV